MEAPVNPLTVFRVRVRENSPAHTRFGVFAGPDVDHLGCAGELILRNEEFPAFMNAITEYNERNEPADPPEPPVARYTGRLRDGTPVQGALALTISPGAFAEKKYRAGWQELRITRGDDEVGGISPHPTTGRRSWWGETS